MGRSTLVVCLALLLVCSPVVVAAHDVNHLSADAQVSPDGTLVLESAYATSDGFVVLYRGWDGRDGEVVGVTEFSAARVDVTEVPVSLNDSAWDAVEGNATVTAVLYADDGERNGTFDPADSPQVSFGRATQVTFDVARGTSPVYVSAAGIGAQRSAGEVTVREVSLAEAGHLVLSLSEGGEPGRTLGHVTLDAGTHENLRVGLNRSFLASRNGTFSVFATAYTDDGDGVLDADDRPVRANGSLVTTRFSVSPVDDVETGTPTSAVNTPTATAPPPTDSPTEATTPSPTRTDGNGPGFGLVAALGALVAALFLGVSRGRRRGGR